MRAVLDPNVVISGLLSSSGAPAAILRAWEQGEFELVISPRVLDELARALADPKLRRRISDDDANSVLHWLSSSATMTIDPDAHPPIRSADPGDDYLIALAAGTTAVLVSGDKQLLDLADQMPVFSPRQFLTMLESD